MVRAGWYQDLAARDGARWERVYEDTTFLTGSIEAMLARQNVATRRNGIGNITGKYEVFEGYSGGARTAVTLAREGAISGDTLVLISPQMVSQQELDDILTAGTFNHIVVYRGDDLIALPRAGTEIPFVDLYSRVFPNGIVDACPGCPANLWWVRLALGAAATWYFSGDSELGSLIQQLEQQAGRDVAYFDIYWEGFENRLEIHYSDQSMESITITPSLTKGGAVEVVQLEDIRHGDWPFLLKKWKEGHDNELPGLVDQDELQDLLEEARREMEQELRRARDPNEKRVDPSDHALPGETLDFTVEFENEGEGIAFGVYVTNTLHSNLDDSTLVLPPPEGGTYDPLTRTITWFIGEVGPSEGGELHLSADVRDDAVCGSAVTNFATVYFPSVPEVTPTNGVSVLILGPECDFDGDTVLDEDDNCPSVPNVDQTNTDVAVKAPGDELGDACDSDDDDDGLIDPAEAYLGTDPLDPDTDNNGTQDGAEDSDGDGLSDGAEASTYFTDPPDTETDGDGFDDGVEVNLGSDPFNPDSTPEHETVPGTCDDGADNDGDGLIDGDDPGCEGAGPTPTPTPAGTATPTDTPSPTPTATPTPVRPDLTVAKSDSPDPVADKGTYQYTLVVDNIGLAAASNVVVEDVLPEAEKDGQTNPVLPVEPLPDGCSFDAPSRTIRCDLGDIPVGESRQVDLTVTAPMTLAHGPGDNVLLTNCVTVDPDNNITETNETNNDDCEDTTILWNCPDSNGDNHVSLPDLAFVALHWRHDIGVDEDGDDDAADRQADLDKGGWVSLPDLALVALHWREDCPVP